MKRASIAVFLALCVSFIAAAGYVAYLDHKLKPIMNSPAVHLNATRFTPIDVAKKRRINLGYANLSIPESIHGDPVNIDSSGVIGVGQDPHYALVFFPPQSSDDVETTALFQDTSATIGEPVRNWFEMKKLILAQQPFSVWQLLSMGKRKAAVHAVLLLLKSSEFSAATSVRVLENDQRGLIISNRAEFTNVLITDFKTGISQGILVTSSAKNLDEVVSAMASDYELHLKKTDIDSVKRLIDSAGIKIVTSSDTSNHRLEEMTAEIVKRRAERIKKSGESGLEKE